MNMLRPKQKRATLINVSFWAPVSHGRCVVNSVPTAEKLFRMFPCVLSVKTRYPEIASVQHATSDIAVEMCVTRAKRSSVGVRRLP